MSSAFDGAFAARSVGESWHAYAAGAIGRSDLERRVHVWRVRLDGFEDPAIANLSDDEILRANKFARAHDKRRFVSARSILRALLADLADRKLAPDDPQAPKGRHLRFGYGPTGKPFLLDDPRLRFNIAHSDELSVIAVTRSGEVGIDIEQERHVDDMMGIARRLFTDAEQVALIGCPAAGREAVFHRIWTRKEALLKAMGTGLAALGDKEAAALPQGAAAFTLTQLPHLDGYVATLARPRGSHGLKLWSWPNALGMREGERRSRPRATALSASPGMMPFRLEARH